MATKSTTVDSIECCSVCLDSILPKEEEAVTAELLCNSKQILAPSSRGVNEALSEVSCKHMFHVDCIRILAKQVQGNSARNRKVLPQCPLCKTPFTAIRSLTGALLSVYECRNIREAAGNDNEWGVPANRGRTRGSVVAGGDVVDVAQNSASQDSSEDDDDDSTLGGFIVNDDEDLFGDASEDDDENHVFVNAASHAFNELEFCRICSRQCLFSITPRDTTAVRCASYRRCHSVIHNECSGRDATCIDRWLCAECDQIRLLRERSQQNRTRNTAAISDAARRTTVSSNSGSSSRPRSGTSLGILAMQALYRPIRHDWNLTDSTRRRTISKSPTFVPGSSSGFLEIVNTSNDLDVNAGYGKIAKQIALAQEHTRRLEMKESTTTKYREEEKIQSSSTNMTISNTQNTQHIAASLSKKRKLTSSLANVIADEDAASIAALNAATHVEVSEVRTALDHSRSRNVSGEDGGGSMSATGISVVPRVRRRSRIGAQSVDSSSQQASNHLQNKSMEVPSLLSRIRNLCHIAPYASVTDISVKTSPTNTNINMNNNFPE